MPRYRPLILAGLTLILWPPASTRASDDVTRLKEEVAAQQKQIDELRAALEEQRKVLDRVVRALPLASESGLVTSTAPVAGALGFSAASTDPAIRSAAEPAAAPRDDNQSNAQNLVEHEKKVNAATANLGGFKFSGDFRLRFDSITRSGNSIAPPLQSFRGRYRLRLNLDKDLDSRFRFHMQLSTGPLFNGLTDDQDLGGIASKHTFSLSEAYMDFHPNSRISLRGGRMEDIFADSSRFLWDNDVKFNGFTQVVNLPVDGPWGVRSVEFRSGEYILTSPNVVILSPTSPFVSAGYQPGQKVRAADLFHPGVVVRGDLSSRWRHQFISDVQIYRNPDQILLSTLTNGFPVVVSNSIGVVLSAPATGAGNAATTSGGAIYSAPHFQIVRAAYRLDYQGLKLGDRAMPFWLDFQASRNTGTSKLRDAVMVSANLGSVRKFGDARFLYQFAIKDANSMIGQFSDDELGIGTGVNIRAHAFRFDLGLTRFLQWQNLFFVTQPRRPSNPEEQFFVPLQPGANAAFRYQGQLAFTF